MNPAMKSREINCSDLHTFVEFGKIVQSSKYDIFDASLTENLSVSQKMTTDFYKGVSKTMEERMKDPRCLLDADALASHVSIVSLSETTPGDQTQTGTTKTRKGKKKGGVSRKSADTSKAGASSASNLKESATESKSSAMSGTSMSVTGTAAGGSSEWVSQKVEFVKSEIPETMNKAFRIIERLLT
jgi:hypothetical protein